MRKRIEDSSSDQWLPASGRVRNVNHYDRAIAALSLDEVYRELATQLTLVPNCRVLDLGCGTGTLASVLRSLQPSATVVGVDRDPRVLIRAVDRWGRKEASAILALAQRLPFPDGTFDVLTATLFLHHLRHREKVDALREAKRVLRVGGWLHVADWTRPRPGIPTLGFLLVRLLDGFERTADHAAGGVGEMIREAGFRYVEEVELRHTWLGSLAFYRARKHADAHGPDCDDPNTATSIASKDDESADRTAQPSPNIL